ncbi:MAG: DNA translocase FtsK [Termitinemataceae bacterium]
MAYRLRQTRALQLASVVFAGAGILLTLGITGSYVSFPLALSSMGAFFIEAYGLLSYWLPLYLFVAAYITAQPYYRPDYIFMLTGSLVPFATISSGLYLIRHFETALDLLPLLQYFGESGLILALISATLVEIFAIYKISQIIKDRWVSTGHAVQGAQPNASNQEPEPPGQVRHPLNSKSDSASPNIAVHERPESLRLLKAPEPELLSKPELLPEAFTEVNPILFDLPEVKPLSSKVTFEKLQATTTSPIDSIPIDTTRIDTIAAVETEIPTTLESIPQGEDSADSTDSSVSDFTTDSMLLSVKKRPTSEDTDQAEHHMKQSHQETKTGIPHPRGGHTPPEYRIPVEGLLTAYPDGQYWIIDQATRDAAVILKETLKEFNIQAEVTGIRKGPVITMFEILPAPGVKLSKIVNLQDNIALRLAASSVRIVAPIPGKHAVGIEVPNRKRNIVSFREMIEGELHREGKRMEIPVILGKDITGEAQTIDLVQTPHLLIAGATGSGKSVCVNSMILSILYQRSPAEVRLMLIDPKIVELKLYNDIPHLLTPVITEPKRAFQALQYCIYEMERRYALLDSMGVRDIRSYNKRIKERTIAAERLPYIVVVIDEFADLMATTGKELESTVARLAAMSRAVGIHLVLATQRPSIDVITGLIKANIPSRIAFMVASKMDSRIIIDMVGAEKLLGRGDMLYAGAVDPFPVRIQGAYVSEEEVERVVEYVKELGQPDYIDDEIFYDEEEEESEPSLFDEGDDPLYEKALEIVYQQGKASASYIQRRLKIGYNRAARIVEMMEERGIVGPAQGSKPRELLRGQ